MSLYDPVFLPNNGNAQRPEFPRKLSAHESHMLILRSTVLVQSLKDLEKVSNEIRELRDAMASLHYDSEREFSRIQANLEDRKITLKCIRNSIVGHRNRLEDILERISREAGLCASRDPHVSHAAHNAHNINNIANETNPNRNK